MFGKKKHKRSDPSTTSDSPHSYDSYTPTSYYDWGSSAGSCDTSGSSSCDFSSFSCDGGGF